MFDLNEKHRQIQETAREFSDKILIPNADRHDRAEEYPKENIQKLADLGFMGILIPESHGGLGLDNRALTCALEEIHRGCASTGVTVSVHNSLLSNPLIHFGNDDQRKRYLPQLATGERLGAYAITEPNFGSDAAGIQATCRREGDKYILNGTKAWITNGGYAEVIITFATLDPSQGSKGICAFIVESQFPGFKVGKKERKLGIRGSDTVQLVFEDLEVPAANLIGEEGQGFKIAMHTLDGGRIGIATQGVGIAQACLDCAMDYANEAHRDGRPLIKSQAVQFEIANMATEIEAARMLTYRAAWRKDQKQSHTLEASKAKLFSSEVANRAARSCVQILGADGVRRGYPAERLLRDAKITEIYEGTSEVQRLVISRNTLSDRAQRRASPTEAS
ncbi:MAG: acyl-CoA dehydrogenase family protein [Planctomycetes bacterium]|nr:acyl-CoA dehydrogenase family protein [Planctomycetota bacterium]